jgi:hypothetical protein
MPDTSLLFTPEEIEPWRREWQDMPEFEQQDLESRHRIIVHFASIGDLQLFAELIEQPLTAHTQSVWFPRVEIGRYFNKRYIQEGGP